MIRASQIVAALMIMALSPAALAQKSSGYMDLNDFSSAYGAQLAVFRVMFSRTDAICPQLTGLFRIEPNGRLTRTDVGLWRDTDLPRRDSNIVKGLELSPPSAPDDFTYRQRFAMESCRIDIDITEQQKRDGEWVPLLSSWRPNAPPRGKIDNLPAMSPAEREAFERDMDARAHAGSLRHGFIRIPGGGVEFEGAKDCFDAAAIYRIDQPGVTLLFPAGLEGELNRFFIERVDADANHGMFYLSRGSCRVGFTISASVLHEGVWSPLPVARPWP